MDLGSILVGGVVGFIVNHFGGFSKEYFDERKRVANHKREVARKVLDICSIDNDGLSRAMLIDEPSRFNRTITDLTAIDSDLGKKLKDYVSYIKDGGLMLEAAEGVMEVLREDLLTWTNSIRIGKTKRQP